MSVEKGVKTDLLQSIYGKVGVSRNNEIKLAACVRRVVGRDSD
jgi:hypothetical protein